jgi:hypothetical protein
MILSNAMFCISHGHVKVLSSIHTFKQQGAMKPNLIIFWVTLSFVMVGLIMLLLQPTIDFH